AWPAVNRTPRRAYGDSIPTLASRDIRFALGVRSRLEPRHEWLPYDMHLGVLPALLRVVSEQRENCPHAFQVRSDAGQRVAIGVQTERHCVRILESAQRLTLDPDPQQLTGSRRI